MPKRSQTTFARKILIAASLFAGPVLSARAVPVGPLATAISPSPWSFSNGPEFPGATGSLSVGVGHTGYGAHLAFDVSAGGNYVSATDGLPTPITAATLSFWVRSPGGVGIQVRVNDSTGQTLQYSPSRPFEATDPGQWYPLTVSLGATTAHFGGSVNDGVVHGAITSVSIMAQPSLTKAGAIDFDDVQLLPAPALLVDPAGAPVATPPVQDLAGSLGVEITHDDATVTGFNLLRWLGFHRVRTEMFWCDIETKAGVYDFSWYDQLVAHLKSYGLKAHFILCYGNAVYTGTDWFQPPRTASAVQAFANFARAAAAHYAGQDVHFELWNEQNNPTFWADPDASAYSPLCALAGAALHAGDAGALVCSGGLAGMDPGFLAGMIADGALGSVDAVGIHPYRPDVPEGLSNDLPATRAQLAQAFGGSGAAVPAVWNTEDGYSSAWYGDGSLAVNRLTQAKFSIRQILTGLGLGLPVQILFDLRDVGTNVWSADDNCGIVDPTYYPKHSSNAVRMLSLMTKGRTFAGIMPSPQSGLHIFKFQGPTPADTLLVLWTESAGPAQRITFPRMPWAAYGYRGAISPVTIDGLGNFSVSVSDTPIYVTFSALGAAGLLSN